MLKNLEKKIEQDGEVAYICHTAHTSDNSQIALMYWIDEDGSKKYMIGSILSGEVVSSEMIDGEYLSTKEAWYDRVLSNMNSIDKALLVEKFIEENGRN